MSEGIAAQLIKVITSHQDIRRVPEPDKILLKGIAAPILIFLCTNKLQDLQLQSKENIKHLYELGNFNDNSIMAETLFRAAESSVNLEMETLFLNIIKEKNEKAEKDKEDKEAIVNYTSRTSLHRAAELGDTEEVKQLLCDHEVDYNYADKNGMTPLHHAVKHGHRLTVVALLAKKEINKDEKDNQGRTPLMHALIEKARTKGEEEQKQYYDIVTMLLASGASALIFDHQHHTPLSRAFATGQIETSPIFQELLNKKSWE
ncbi:hypothetical protein MY4038_008494 [Beauveria bassiana]